MEDTRFPYSLDRHDRIVAVGDAWLDFARRNDAEQLTRERVIGSSLWDFIAGRETRNLYEAFFQRVRSGEGPFVIPFRCDSPDRFRFMRLVVAPGEGGCIDCHGILVREQLRPYYSILDQAFPRNESRLAMCSLCKKVQALGTRWLTLEDAVQELDLFGSASVPSLDYRLCDACRAESPRQWGGSAAA